MILHHIIITKQHSSSFQYIFHVTFLHLYTEIIGFLMCNNQQYCVTAFKWNHSSLSVDSAQRLCEAVTHCKWTYMERRALLTSQKLCFDAKSTQQGAGQYLSLSYIFPFTVFKLISKVILKTARLNLIGSLYRSVGQKVIFAVKDI